MSEDVMLHVDDITVNYGPLVPLRNASMRVARGEVVCILGPNGSGKSTLVNSVAGVVGISSGQIRLAGDRVDSLPAHQRVRRGVSLVPERRRLFADMTLLDNLRMGNVVVPRGERQANLDRILDRFPKLRERAQQKAGSFSGGEQQLIAFARGLLSRPRVLIVDEPFLGLSPGMRNRTVELIRELADEDSISVVFIEQNIPLSMSVSDRVYVLRSGEVVRSGPANEFGDEAEVRRIFLGV